MRLIKTLSLSAILLGILSCDDALVDMDLSPPLAGHLWRVYGGLDEFGFGSTYLVSYSFREGYDGFKFYNTPFDGGDAYGVACGDGRVWVTGYISEDLGGYSALWEAEGETYRDVGGGGGLTYDGEYLWYGVGASIYRIDPDTGEEEFMYRHDEYGIGGALAWVDGYLWVLLGDGENHRFEQWDVNTWEALRIVPLPKDDPYLSEPRGLAWDGEAFWVNDLKSSRMYRLDGKDGHILGYIEMQEDEQLPRDEPWGLAFGQGPTTPTK